MSENDKKVDSQEKLADNLVEDKISNKKTAWFRSSRLSNFLSFLSPQREKSKDSVEYKIAEIKSKYKTYLAIFLICIVTINVIFTFGIVLFVRNNYQNAVDRAYDDLKSNLYKILTDDVKQKVTDEVLRSHMREYYLPEDYFSIGTYVRANARSAVVEVVTGASSGNIVKRGTGLILNSDGYIITNTHIITHIVEEMAGNIEQPIKQTTYIVYDYIGVKIAGGIGEYKAQQIAYDKDKDIAIIKLEKMPDTTLKNVQFTLSDYVSIGEDIAIMGNTLGLGVTVSLGSVLNIGQYSSGENVDVNMLMLDALTLEGNSGAGVFNPLCEVVGMVSFKMISLSDSDSICYAITSMEIIEYIQEVNAQEGYDISYSYSANANAG